MFCCGSGSDFGKVSVPFRFRQFLKTKIAQTLAFSMSEAAYFPENWPLIVYFFTFFITFYVGSESKAKSYGSCGSDSGSISMLLFHYGIFSTGCPFN
jgi:hypothetical protein